MSTNTIITGFIDILQKNPELTVFLILALGFALGRITIGSFKIGVVLGTLFAGVIVGQIGINIPPMVKIIFFDLFLFSTGYKVGPQFFQGLKKNAFPQLALTVVISVSSLLTAVILGKLLKYDVGTTAGLLAGAFSESTVIGTASEAINRLSLSDIEKTKLINNIPVAYAATYLIGATSLVYYMTTIAPKLIRVNLVEESKKLSHTLAEDSTGNQNLDLVFKRWIVRAYKITNESLIGLTLDKVEKMYSGFRIDIQRLRHNGQIVEPEPGLTLNIGDIIVVMAQNDLVANSHSIFGPEVLDEELLNFPLAHMNITVTRKEMNGIKTSEFLKKFDYGIRLDKIRREYHEIPFNRNTELHSGDVLSVTGKKEEVESAAKKIGYLDRLNVDTDIIFVGLGIVLGGLLGLLSVNILGIEVTLTSSGGALVMGLFFGWIHSKTPVLGRIPEPALWIFDNVGLATFVGLVGLAAGPSFISSLKEIGFSIVLAGISVAILPHIIGLLFGYFILKMNPIILLGAQTGAGTSTIALKAVQDASASKYPVLGYTIPYALGNIILTAWGPVIVGIMS